MWVYNQANGILSCSGTVYAMGYSGAPSGKNNPAMQDVPDVGPIPRGTYTIGEPFDSPTHGPFAMHLTPAPTNVMYGRDGFLMHGDSLEHPGAASEGCIIMQRAVRETVWNSLDRELVVV